MTDLKVLEDQLKEAKKTYRSMLEKLYVQEVTQEEHDRSLSEYLRLTSKVRKLRKR